MPLLVTSEKCRATRRGKKNAPRARIDFYTPRGRRGYGDSQSGRGEPTNHAAFRFQTALYSVMEFSKFTRQITAIPAYSVVFWSHSTFCRSDSNWYLMRALILRSRFLNSIVLIFAMLITFFFVKRVWS